MEKKPGNRCATCRKELKQGMDVLQLQEGILGIMGFVALDEPKLFCDVACLKGHFNGSKGYVLPQRIP